MADPHTNNAADAATKVAQAVAEKGAEDPSFVDSVWSLISSAFAAFAGWAAAHWSDIGMGAVAVVMVWACVAAMKPPLDWVFARKPVKDDTRKLAIRGLAVVWSAIWSMALGFREHFGDALGVDLPWYVALPGGTALTSGLAIGGYHFYKWARFADTPGARQFRGTLRIWGRRASRVSEDELHTARTTTGQPPVTEEMIAEHRASSGNDPEEQ